MNILCDFITTHCTHNLQKRMAQNSELKTQNSKILIVCSKNSGRIAPFITDQVEGLIRAGVECDYFTIEGKGVWGYLSHLKRLNNKIREFEPNLIHAHYGLSGLLANLQRKIPVVTTYHGSDINHKKAFRFSKVAIRLSAWNIFVSQKNISKAGVSKCYSLMPCGVDLSVFKPVDKNEARKALGLSEKDKLVLFAGSFTNKVKNPELAMAVANQIPDIKLIELNGYTREQVALLMNAMDACLMTSHTEGSPQFIKEAMACNCPVVSVNVGDVAEIIGETKGCYICSYNEKDIITFLNSIFHNNIRTNGRQRIKLKKFDSDTITANLLILYDKICNK